MAATITNKDALLFLIMGGAIVLILYVISLIQNLITTVKHTNTIMADAEVITKIAKERAEDVDKMMDGLAESVTGITSPLKGKESIIRSLSSIASAITSIVNILKK